MTEKSFRTKIRVLYGDTDAGGVVYNANYLRYFEFGRTEMMRERVCSYREIEELGFILPVTECWARYKAPAFYDEQGLVAAGDALSDFSGAIKAIGAGRRAAVSIQRILHQLPVNLTESVVRPGCAVQDVDHRLPVRTFDHIYNPGFS